MFTKNEMEDVLTFIRATRRIQELIKVVDEDAQFDPCSAVSSDVFRSARRFIALLCNLNQNLTCPMITAGFNLVSFEWKDVRVDIGPQGARLLGKDEVPLSRLEELTNEVALMKLPAMFDTLNPR